MPFNACFHQCRSLIINSIDLYLESYLNFELSFIFFTHFMIVFLTVLRRNPRALRSSHLRMKSTIPLVGERGRGLFTVVNYQYSMDTIHIQGEYANGTVHQFKHMQVAVLLTKRYLVDLATQ